ncbi:hypothetical protein V6N11_039680 [Hibiscus sabdariffa]|uniref:Uncharacterized protein n=1 Tax=Hibiscus sabdariffa TaxID=183260 RepID=A0ABR2SNG5_9ROSI
MESGCHGRFGRMAVEIDLQKPLISKIPINGQTQLEFKTSNTNVVIVTSAAPSSTTPDKPTPYDKSNLFRPWMLVERRSQKNTIEQNEQNHCESGLNITESRFNPIFETSEPSSTTMDRPTTTTMSFTSEIVSAVTFMVKSHAHVSAIVPSVSLSGSSMYGPLVVPAAAAVFDTMSIPTPKVSTKLSVIEKKQSSQTTTLGSSKGSLVIRKNLQVSKVNDSSKPCPSSNPYNSTRKSTLPKPPAPLAKSCRCYYNLGEV